MNIRPLELLDLPILRRHRNDAVTLDSARALTRGNPLGTVAFLSHFNPARHIFTAIAKDNGTSLLGSVIHTRDESFARLVYLAPTTQLTHPELPALVDSLSAQAGAWGALHVLAELDETSIAFPALRTAGFAVYARQRLWDVSSIVSTADADKESTWVKAREVDMPAIQNLYYQIVPPLLQPIEPRPSRADGFIATAGGANGSGARSYVSVNSGSLGIVLTPLIHPEVTDVGASLAALIRNLPGRGALPVYLCVRSYQAWLEPALADLGATASPRQAVMVKHLARMVKEEQTLKAVQPAGVTVQPSRVSRMQTKK